MKYKSPLMNKMRLFICLLLSLSCLSVSSKKTIRINFQWYIRLIATDNNSDGVLVYHSPDLINYEDEKRLKLNDNNVYICFMSHTHMTERQA